MIDTRHDRTGHVFQSFQTVKSIVRFDGKNADATITLFEVPAWSHAGAARANPRDKVGDASLGLVPDLRAGGLIMRDRVRWVEILIRLEIPPRCLVQDLTAQTNRPI